MQKYILILIVILNLVLFGSCRKTEDLTNTEDFFYLRNDGADMPVFVEGNVASRNFVIVLHGGPGGDSQIYNDYKTTFSETLENKYAMVYYDQRGSGTTTGKYDNSDLEVAQFVDDLDKLIELLKNKYGSDIKLFVMGHSWGGTLGTAYLLTGNNQQKIAGWIEVDGAHNWKSTKEVYLAIYEIAEKQIAYSNHNKGWDEIYEYCKNIDTTFFADTTIAKLNKFGFEIETYLTETGEIYNTLETSDLGDILNHTYTSSFNPMTAKFNLYITNASMFQTLKEIDYTPEMNKITIPTLIIWGKYDFVIPLSLGYEAYNAIGSSDKKIVVLQNSGHSGMYNEMDLFLSHLMAFIDSH